MNTGQYISGVGHLGLIGWLLFGGSFAPAPDPFEVSEVAVVTGEAFEEMMTRAQSPETATEVASPEPPPLSEVAPEVTASADTPPEVSEPENTPPTPPDTVPDISQITAPPQAEVSDEPPEIQPPSDDVAALVPEVSERPQPRPVPRVAPEPVAQPEPETKVDDAVREATEPSETAEEPLEEQVETAPEEAASEIVTEAEQDPSAAPSRSMRPKTRPAAPPAPQETAVDEPAEQRPAPKPAEELAETPADTGDAVESALAEALGGGNEQPLAAPSGPPLTGSEKESLRVAVSACWNVGSLSSEALRTTVVVGVAMQENGMPEVSSIRMLSSSGGNEGGAQQAFDAARRAIIRCAKSGYALPLDKYDHWREIEMTFNPEKMRIK